MEREKAHLGYRRLANDEHGPRAGSWIVRHYLGKNTYQLERIGLSDDLTNADGVDILSFDQAIEQARARMAVRAENTPGKAKRPWTVQDAIDDYLAYLNSEEKSERDARYKAEAFILPKFGQHEIASLDVDELRKWLTNLSETPARVRTAKTGKRAKKQQYRELKRSDQDALRRRKATANRVLTILKAALNRAFHDGKVKSDSVWRRVKPFKKVEAARQEFLSVPEARRVMNACEPDFRSLVQAALLTGCRYGELCRFQVKDFDPDNETIRVRVAKSGKPRDVILTTEGLSFFNQLVAGRGRAETILLRQDGSAWQTSQQIRPMKEACERAKIEPAVGFHALRHSWASLAVMGGVPLLVVAGNLGHSDTRMVEKHYGHLTKDYQKQQINKGAPKFGIKSKSSVVRLHNASR